MCKGLRYRSEAQAPPAAGFACGSDPGQGQEGNQRGSDQTGAGFGPSRWKPPGGCGTDQKRRPHRLPAIHTGAP